VVPDGEQAVGLARQYLLHARRTAGLQLLEGASLEGGAAEQHVARLAVGVDDAAGGTDEEDRRRRAVERRLQQQLALAQQVTLLLQQGADVVVEPRQLAELVVALGGEADA